MFELASLMGIAVFVGLLFISVAFHETMHALVALKLGDDLAHSRGRISLNPMKHIDPILTLVLPTAMLLLGLTPILAAKPVPINTNRISGDELGLAAVGIAGPFTNLALASLSAVTLNIFLSSPGIAHDLMTMFVQINVALFVFNMMPIPPLDGSRLLYAFAPVKVQQVMERMEQMGMMMIIVILMVLIPIIGPVLTGINEFILGILIR